MELEIFLDRNWGYRLNIKNEFNIGDAGIAINYLNIDREDYRKILFKYGATQNKHNGLYFSNFKDIEKCLNSPELEPYLMMLKLIG